MSLTDKINQFYLPEWLSVEIIAGNFISFTPLFSYGSTILSIYRKESSLGFSIDICATMIIASTLRIAYYFIIPYEIALLRQSIVMVVIQVLLLKVSLVYRPRSYDADILVQGPPLTNDLKNLWVEYTTKKLNLQTAPVFTREVFVTLFVHFVRYFDPSFRRYKKFWQWNSETPYWGFLIKFWAVITILTFLMQKSTMFGGVLGTVGLFIESLLPLPQILLLNNLKSVEGFKMILLVSWLCGDFTKISYLMYGAKNISAIFLIFAVFQMSLDFYIAFQYVYFKYYYEPEQESLEMRDLQSAVTHV
ncbi:Any1p CYBJADRAFT_168998 [Cyberlindnera jadinii NRRL Y-1542]|uniref:PQ-loop-domain-containing protein n=1 Tax=Cyberlindnera jadinii (strain ATCC 18201 / CBS 1600 / BCRC 20928 / JCM 3617 / NBRC 0987 / NRRL Y-1542) TaxID=983966 RepID=A0A1E4RXH4_CYBJN|nr:hypothetical protein CYBJADRAFT_168998 [Cyberlindnera jadinii NRRL Y-1542]ODV71977.1 hypothetical protein CYBJADRAFT_168998 [Cyberlindnera jadinii NRRL Y-1542]